MNAIFSRQLAQLVQQPPADLDLMTVIQIREQLVAATDRGRISSPICPMNSRSSCANGPGTGRHSGTQRCKATGGGS